MSYLFKKEIGENFSDYVRALRLEKARALLLTTDMAIDDISLAVGYANTSSFRRKFKQTTGMTPSKLRSPSQS
ncbi:MAG: helix-turn-helix transcriptional regulator [Lachnospiraceae bacterium]|nr:helix-turn-helix transcriptional regulator [Lachnospiraceae bacterium]